MHEGLNLIVSSRLIVSSIFVKIAVLILTGLALNLKVAMGSVDILTILSLMIQEHGICSFIYFLIWRGCFFMLH